MIRKNGIEVDKALVKPFLRWVGGKQKIVNELIKYLPAGSISTYWEPFVGSGALFFAISPTKAILSDINSALINCYIHIRDNPSIVHNYLDLHLRNSSEGYYYQIRKQYNMSGISLEQTARFIYLNRTNFNGIYRVNRNGEYNVPYGFREPPPYLEAEHLLKICSMLKNTKLAVSSYSEILNKRFDREDFIYLDPPYPPLSVNMSSFNHYNERRFDWNDHKKLAEIANKLNNFGCKLMLSYTDIPHIRSLYQGWNFFPLAVIRYVSSDGMRNKVQELIITNYSVNID